MWNDAPIGFSCYLWQLSKLKSSKKLCFWWCLPYIDQDSQDHHGCAPDVSGLGTAARVDSTLFAQRSATLRPELRNSGQNGWAERPIGSWSHEPNVNFLHAKVLTVDWTFERTLLSKRTCPTRKVGVLQQAGSARSARAKTPFPSTSAKDHKIRKQVWSMLCISRACLRTYRGFYIKDIWERKSALSCLISDVSELSSLKNKWFCNIC